MKTERFSIVWQACGKDSQAAERFFVPGYKGYLPFFVWGDDLVALENKEKVELREEHLLKGILYGLHEFENNPLLWHQKKDKETLLYLLDVLGNGFKYDSPEKMILDVAYKIREKNGNKASHIVLKVGSKLIPESSKIKSDLICDIWAVASLGDNEKNLLQELTKIVEQTKLDEIHSDAKEVICYYGFCAMVLLECADLVNYLEKFIYPNVTNMTLKQNIKNLLDNPTKYNVSDLKVV